MPPPTLWVPRNPSEQLTRRVDIREQDRRACRAVATGLDPDRRCAAASSLLRAGLLSKGARRTMFVVVIEELAEDRFELTAMEHQHPAEALPADDPDEPIGGRVRTRRPDRRGDVPDALRGEHLVEAGGELGISVPDQELRLATPLGQDEAQIKSLLGDPLHRVGGGAAQLDAPGVELDEEEHVEPAHQHRVDREEVTCQHRRRLGTQDLRPGRTRAFRRWLDAVAAQDRPHRRRGKTHAHFGQLALDFDSPRWGSPWPTAAPTGPCPPSELAGPNGPSDDTSTGDRPDLDASRASFRAAQGTDPGGRRTSADSSRRGPHGRLASTSDGRPGDAGSKSRVEVRRRSTTTSIARSSRSVRWNRNSWSMRTKASVEEGQCHGPPSQLTAVGESPGGGVGWGSRHPQARAWFPLRRSGIL